jgi:hypothetical protein
VSGQQFMANIHPCLFLLLRQVSQHSICAHFYHLQILVDVKNCWMKACFMLQLIRVMCPSDTINLDIALWLLHIILPHDRCLCLSVQFPLPLSKLHSPLNKVPHACAFSPQIAYNQRRISDGFRPSFHMKHTFHLCP